MTGGLRLTPLLAVWLPFVAVLGLLYMTIPPSPDQSQFDWMAFIATQGQPFYVGSFDMNWPGAMWLHEAGIRLFGVHPWTWRLTDFILALGFTVAGSVFLVRANWPSAAIIFAFLYPPIYITAGWWMAGQRDIIAGGFLLVACALCVPHDKGGSRGLASVMAGLAVAAAVLIRPTYLSFFAGLLVLEALPLAANRSREIGRLGRAGRFTLGLMIGIGGVVLAGLALGSLDDWYRQSVEFALSIYVSDPPQDVLLVLHGTFVRSWHWITVLAVLGLILWLRRDGPSHALVLILGVAATSAVSFIAQGKNFGYHLGGILPVLVLFAATALEGLFRAMRQAGTGIAVQGLAGLLVLASGLTLAGTTAKLVRLSEGARLVLSGDLGPSAGFGLTESSRDRIVEIIREGSDPTETVVVYGTNYELAYRAQRLPTYRFFTPAADLITEDFPYYEAWLTEVETALAEGPPAFVILDRGLLKGSLEIPEPVVSGRPILDRLIAHLSRNHEVAFANDHIVLYRRQR